ncbi:MAG: hypothetical protein CO150_01150 [Nitrospirae bacterium CG_4_9_14_3_um_filter_53_35]|nr:MAG: hypothetical protein AUK29_10540 [Nitrospirae bacterium CG2_30_53_67]PIV82305.1 MAG: hypothetical protein COW52_14310 [Nitrospirae bacterium CG17_big_fil_post_rev_8_21_14_2_50_50_9]PIW84657.1 MAG: hypothetical protein COZ95_08660 [Nitrospirae bacterium CG_4_8_14_3_um_filter_50_41]PIX84809.1 MAG: hypothetical protein COZ32_11630 [Nitrospirae bacterium CG_4_10_14_3_um_filter_53_41]PJA77395.1 MAG: hypothetical protein CO150_01150 [Nitrospirae bacterium CG_4_9_14_3_um_filter_53_35]
MDTERLVFFRDIILSSRDKLLRSVKGIESEINAYMGQQLIEFNERSGEETAVHLLNKLDYRQKKELSFIEEALSRIRSKTYGICIRCGKNIPEDRLLALPYTTACKPCAVKET